MCLYMHIRTYTYLHKLCSIKPNIGNLLGKCVKRFGLHTTSYIHYICKQRGDGNNQTMPIGLWQKQ